jgi:hypothetical protein
LQQFLLPKLNPSHAYEVRPRKDKRGVDLISDALPFGAPNGSASPMAKR